MDAITAPTEKQACQKLNQTCSTLIEENADIIFWGTSIIDLDQYLQPDLVIEVANTSLADDKGEKSFLYEDLKAAEYWIIDVQNVRVIAFNIFEGSQRITHSQIPPGLAISVREGALQPAARQIRLKSVPGC